MAKKSMAAEFCGTCPVCENTQKVRGQRLVLHGYLRPGWGHVNGRCYGVECLAWEISPNGAIAFLAEVLIPRRDLATAWLADLTADTVEKLPWTSGWARPEGGGPLMPVTEHIGKSHEKWAEQYARALREAAGDVRDAIFDVNRFVTKIAAWKAAPLKPVLPDPKHMRVEFNHYKFEWQATPVGSPRVVARYGTVEATMQEAIRKGWSLEPGVEPPAELVLLDYLKECAALPDTGNGKEYFKTFKQPWAAKIALEVYEALGPSAQQAFKEFSVYELRNEITWWTTYQRSMKVPEIVERIARRTFIVNDRKKHNADS